MGVLDKRTHHEMHVKIRRKRGPHKLRRATRKKRIRIIVGSESLFKFGWICTDIEYLNLLKEENWSEYFQDNIIDAILAEHVWEHLSSNEAKTAAYICFKYIKPGGYLRVAVPDGNHPNQNYIEKVRPGGSGAGADEHKALYTYEKFSKIFEEMGFHIDLLEYFDENKKFHFKFWNPRDGKIIRSKRFDPRNKHGNLNYTSLIIDAYKPKLV